MKNLIISIALSSIIDDVSLNSAYAGAKSNDDGSLFSRVATISDDRTLLSKFLTETCGMVTDRLKEFIVSSSLDSSNFSLKLEISNAFDESLAPFIKDDIHSAIVSGVIYRWFRFTFPDRAEEWKNQSVCLLSSALSKLCQRRKPVKN